MTISASNESIILEIFKITDTEICLWTGCGGGFMSV